MNNNDKVQPRIRCLGGVGTVTGSRHLVETADRRALRQKIEEKLGWNVVIPELGRPEPLA